MNLQNLATVHELDCANLHKPDIIDATDTWFSIGKPARPNEILGYDLPYKDHSTRGGGVAQNVFNSLNLKKCDLNVLDRLKCVCALI